MYNILDGVSRARENDDGYLKGEMEAVTAYRAGRAEWIRWRAGREAAPASAEPAGERLRAGRQAGRREKR